MASSGLDTKKRLALAITDFLHTSLKDGTLTTEDTESVEVATSCIADAFKIDPSDSAAVAQALGPGQNLVSIYSVYEKLKAPPNASGSSKAESSGSTSQHEAGAAGATGGTSTASNAEAESLKQQGNVAMQSKDYEKAIDLYGKAIAIAPTNAIYLSNRAAAYSATKQHELARNDAEMAVASDPGYTKAWSRLGLARFALGDAKGSMEAYKSGIDAEGNGGSDAMKKGYETAKKKVEEDAEDDVTRSPPGGAGMGAGGGGMPDLSSLAGMFGGGGGGGAGGAGGGGMPDLGSMMNNPMFKNIANQVMSNPDMMNNLMNNPQLRDMASRMGGGGGGAGAGAGGSDGGGGGGGGMPDIGAMMNDPNLRQMAQQFMGGMGGGSTDGSGGPDAGRGGSGTG